MQPDNLYFSIYQDYDEEAHDGTLYEFPSALMTYNEFMRWLDKKFRLQAREPITFMETHQFYKIDRVNNKLIEFKVVVSDRVVYDYKFIDEKEAK